MAVGEEEEEGEEDTLTLAAILVATPDPSPQNQVHQRKRKRRQRLVAKTELVKVQPAKQVCIFTLVSLKLTALEFSDFQKRGFSHTLI